jgi:hypothetical protein
MQISCHVENSLNFSGNISKNPALILQLLCPRLPERRYLGMGLLSKDVV